jgi:hypothetical protein
VFVTVHYHGTPITPRPVLLELAGRSFCVSYAAPGDVEVCHRIGEQVMLDNGAFSVWRRGAPTDWPGYYGWCERWLEYRTTWAVIPDVIDGDEAANDALLRAWPFGDRGAPVWHMHESLRRLEHLCAEWPRVSLGSSGAYAAVGDARWHNRMAEAMNAVCGDGPAPVWFHMLRGAALAGSEYPFASVDSTNVARNHAGTNGGRPRKSAGRMAAEIDGFQCPARWRMREPHPQLGQRHT